MAYKNHSERKIVIKCKDREIELSFLTVHIFATKYKKNVGTNEFHAPAACKLIVESNNRLWTFLLSRPYIISDSQGDIEILVNSSYKKVTLKTPYATKEEIDKARELVKVYKHKSSLGLTPIEVIEKARMETIVNIADAQSIKVPERIGGGF